MPLGPTAPRGNSITLMKSGIIGVSPGRAIIKGAGSPRTWNAQQGYGADGASLLYAGAALSSFEVAISIWKEPQHWIEWEVFVPLLAKPAALPLGVGLPEFALSITHPQLNAKPWEIRSVVVEDVSQWEQDDVGLWTCTIKFKAYRKPKPVLDKAREPVPGTDQSIPDPVDPAEKIIAELRSKNAALDATLHPRATPAAATAADLASIFKPGTLK